MDHPSLLEIYTLKIGPKPRGLVALISQTCYRKAANLALSLRQGLAFVLLHKHHVYNRGQEVPLFYYCCSFDFA
jgi:hypothetical protein